MFGLSRSVTLALVGWLWADILLGMFVIFLAAASPPVKLTQQDKGIDPKPIEVTIEGIDTGALLGTDQSRMTAEQQKFVDAVKQKLGSERRQVAMVFAYGKFEQDAIKGSELAKNATAKLTADQFSGAVIRPLHDLDPGAPAIFLEIYVYR